MKEDDLKGPLVILKVAKSSLDLHLGTILGRVGSVVGLDPIVIISSIATAIAYWN